MVISLGYSSGLYIHHKDSRIQRWDEFSPNTRSLDPVLNSNEVCDLPGEPPETEAH